MSDRRELEGDRPIGRRVGGCGSTWPRRGYGVRLHGHAHASLVRRCADSGIRLVEGGGAIVPFSPWSCESCGRRDDLVIAGMIAFCSSCLAASPREDDDDVYQDTGGGD